METTLDIIRFDHSAANAHLCVGSHVSWVPDEKVSEYPEMSQNIPHRGVDGWRQITHRCIKKAARRCSTCDAPVCGKHSFITKRNPEPRCPAHRE